MRRRAGAARAARARAAADVRHPRRPARPSDPAAAAGAGGEHAPSASAASRARAATTCVVERRGNRIERLRPADRLLRELARRRLGRGRQPAPRLPADQQELRALLRLRRPLMLTLPPRPPPTAPRHRAPRPTRGRSLAIRHVDAGSCNGCEHELTLASRPLLRPPALRPRHRRLAAPRRRAARHRPGHEPHARPAARRLRRDARAAPRRRARRLRARLNMLGTADNTLSERSKRSSRSMSDPGLPTRARRDRRGAPDSSIDGVAALLQR